MTNTSRFADMMRAFTLLTLLGLGTASCSQDLAVQFANANSQKTSIHSLDKVVANGGDSLSFTGEMIGQDIKIAIGDKEITPTIIDSKTGSFNLPEGLENGPVLVSFKRFDKTISQIPLLIGTTRDSVVSLPLDADDVCSDLIFKNVAGEIVRGLNNCQVKTCEEDGQTECVASEERPSVSLETLASQIPMGESFFGITGGFCTEVPIKISADASSLSETVSDLGVFQYKFKIREVADPSCTDPALYSEAFSVAHPLVTHFADRANGELQLCVLGMDANGVWSPSASTQTWTKKVTASLATITGAPIVASSNPVLNATVGGLNITHYRYKIRGALEPNCSDSINYSSELPVSSVISDDLTSRSDGFYELCVIGKSAEGVWQQTSVATRVGWAKDTAPPTLNFAADATYPSGNSNATILNSKLNVSESISYKYKVRSGSDPTCSDPSSYSSETSTGISLAQNIIGLADGLIEICLVGRDSAGNWQDLNSATTYTWTKDTAGPTALITGAPAGINNVSPLAISISGAGVTHYQYKLRATTDPACSVAAGYSSDRPSTTPITDAPLIEGATELCVIGRDSLGNYQLLSAATTASWTRDSLAPTILLSGQPTGQSSVTSLNVSTSGADVVEYRYKIRSASSSACSSSTGYSAAAPLSTITDDISSLADGQIEICAVGRDAVGNWQSFTSATSALWTKDTTPPTASISGAPTGTSNQTLLSVLIAGSDVSHYRYKVREATDPSCSSSSGYSVEFAISTLITADASSLGDGPLELCVVGRDLQNNWQLFTTATTATWIKDSTGPTIILSSVPQAFSSVLSLNATASGTDVVEYRFKIRSSSDALCSSMSDYSAAFAISTPLSSDLSSLSDGTLELCAIGKDSSGNWQAAASASTYSWVKDTLAPTASATGAPSGLSNATSLAITISGADVVQYAYKIRESSDPSCSIATGYGPSIPIATPISNDISTLSDGAIQLCLIGSDAAGNWQSHTASTNFTWTKDTSNPTASLSGQPTGENKDLVLNVTVGGTNIVSYRYKIRSGADAACSSAAGYSADTPVATLITNDISAISDGPIELCVVGIRSDLVAQAESAATTAAWTKDTQAPTALLSAFPSGSSKTTLLNATISGAGVTHYKFKIRETGDPSCSNVSGYSSEIAIATPIASDISALADGTLEACVIGRDLAGNWQAEGTASSSSWTKDTVAPIATLSGEPTGTNNTTVLNVTVGGAGVVNYKYKVSGPTDTLCSDPTGYSAANPIATAITADISGRLDGTIQLCVVGEDSAGNWQLEGTSTIASWTKDTLASLATISGAPTGISNASALNVTVGGTGIVEYRAKLRQGADPLCTSLSNYDAPTPTSTAITSSLAGFADGSIELCVIGKDNLGNWQSVADASTGTWTKDATPPVATLSGEPSGTNNTTLLSITVSGTDVTHYRYKVGASPADCSNGVGYSGETALSTLISADISALADGPIEICVVGRDAPGNWQTYASATTDSWIKNTTAPTVVLSGSPTGRSNESVLSITLSGAGVVSYKYKIREAADASCAVSSGYSGSISVSTPITTNISALADGILEVCAIGVDSVGNWQAEASATSVSWTRDTTPDSAIISGAPTATNNTVNLNVTVSGAFLENYRYKIRTSVDSACSINGGYSTARAIATPITDTISSLVDGAIELCVIGQDTAGNWQLFTAATTASWTKKTVGPTVALSGYPTGTNNLTSLIVGVSGTDVTHYRYKVRVHADTLCTDVTGYSAEIDVTTPINGSLSALPDGVIQLCAIGRDSLGNWQNLSTPTAVSWTKDTAAPNATLTNQPTGTNNVTLLNVTVGGTDVVNYKFKLRDTTDSACSDNTGYSVSTPVGTAITSSVSSKQDGAIQLCVIGEDSSGNWQLESSATIANWTKNTTGSIATLVGLPTGESKTINLNATVAGTDIVLYRYKIRTGIDPACTNAAGYSADVAVATPITDNISGLSDGEIEICVIGRDSIGNWQSEALATSGTWTKDTAAPTATILSAPSGTNNVTLLSVTIAGSGVTHYKYKVRQPASSACSVAAGYSAEIPVATLVSQNISALPDGAIELCVVGGDLAGNWQTEASSSSASWTKDTTAPVALLSGQPTGTNNVTTLNVTISGTDVTHYKFKIRQSGDAACSSATGYSSTTAVATPITSSINGLADGALELCVIGADSLGNWQTEASASTATWTKDTTASVATLTGAPSGSTNIASLNVSVGGTDIVNYRYKLRVSADPLCSSSSGYSASTAVGTPITSSLTGFANTIITLCVVGQDSAGNWQDFTASTNASFTRDTVAPTAQQTGAPAGSSQTTALAITVGGTDVTHYRYKLREPANDACSVSAGYSVETAIASIITDNISSLTDGTIELCLIGRDNAGNWQSFASATSVSWTKDTVAPTATVSGQPSSSSNATSLAVTVAGVGVTAYKYKVQDTSGTACSSTSGYSAETLIATYITSSLTALLEGTITLCVIGRDSAGNWQLESAATVVTWTKDTTAPTAVINSAPTGTNNVTTLSATISGAGVTHYKYRVRDGGGAACSVATGYSASTPIGTSITSSISGLSDGVIELCVIGADAAGNWQTEATASSATWTKDTAAPTATLSGTPSATTNATSLNVTVAGTDVVNYKFKLRVAADPACSSSANYSSAVPVSTNITSSLTSYSDVLIQLCVIGQDTAGNWQAEGTATNASFTRDTSAPAAIQTGAPTGQSNAASLNVTVSGTGVTHYRYKVRATADAACSDITNYSTESAVATLITHNLSAFPEGALELCLVGRDSAGNYQALTSATTATWTKDSVAPTATLSGAPTGSSNATTLSVLVSGSGVTSYKYKVKDTSGTSCSNSAGYSAETPVGVLITSSISGLLDGAIDLCVIGRDSAGNWQLEGVATTASWTKDVVAPTATINSAPTGSSNVTTLAATVAGTDVTQYRVKVRDNTTSACSVSTGYSAAVPIATGITSSISAMADGAMELCVVGGDSAGNWQLYSAATSATWVKDTVAPTAALTNAPTGVSNTTSLNVTVSGTGVVQYRYKIRTTNDCTTNTNYSAPVAVGTPITDSISGFAQGNIYLCALGIDSAGNTQAAASATSTNWVLDTVAPTATISGAPTGTNNTTSLSITVGGTGVVSYKAKLRAPGDTACSNTSGYGAATPVATLYTSNISALAEGAYSLCVIGQDSAGNWQLEGVATIASWTKDTTAPTATISGIPSSPSSTTALNVTIAGTDVATYRYKVRGSSGTACTDSAGYSAPVNVSTAINNDISALADGTVEICAVGIDSSGNQQAYASATISSWTKKTTADNAVISGAPTGKNATTTLAVTISGTTVTHYRYKLKDTADTACSDSSGYSAQTAVASQINQSISAKAEGSITLCVVGLNTAGVWQSYASATTATWTKDALLPVVPASFATSPRASTVKGFWTSGGGDTQGYLILRRASNAVASTPVAGTTYNPGDTIGTSTVAYASNATSSTLGALTPGTRYHFAIFAYDEARNYSSSLTSNALALTYEPPAADDLKLWYDAANSQTFTNAACSTATTNDSEIYCLRDLSTSGVTLLQPTTSLSPTFYTQTFAGGKGFKFWGGEYLQTSTSALGSGNVIHSIVYIGSNHVANKTPIHIGSDWSHNAIKITTRASGQLSYTFINNDLTYPQSIAGANVILGTYNGVDGTSANKKLYVNGVELTSPTASGTTSAQLSLPSTSTVTLGAYHSSGPYELNTGDAGEILFYNTLLTQAQRQDLGKYAWKKYGIPQISLVSSQWQNKYRIEVADGVGTASKLVLVRVGAPPTFQPVDGVTYTMGATHGDSFVSSVGAVSTFNLTPLTPGSTYHVAIYGRDDAGNYYPAVRSRLTAIDAPTPQLLGGSTVVSVSWPKVQQASGYLLVRGTGSAPSFTPTNGVSYATGSAGGSDVILVAGNSNYYHDTALTNGTTYHYKIFSYDASNYYTAGASASKTPNTGCDTSAFTLYSSVALPVTNRTACTSASVIAHGGTGGAGAASFATTSNTSGAGGTGVRTTTSSTISLASQPSILIAIGQGGKCGGVGGGGSETGTVSDVTSGRGGTGGLVNADGSNGSGASAGGAGGGTGTNGGYAGGAGYRGGGGGGGSFSASGGGGGGATAVKVGTSSAVIAGGGGGGGAMFSNFHTSSVGGSGCGNAGTSGTNGGGGGGAGGCAGPVSISTAIGTLAGGEGVSGSGKCEVWNDGVSGYATITLAP